MQLINTDILFVFILMAVLSLSGAFLRNLSFFKAGLRRVTAIDAFDEAVRICAEKGRPIYVANFVQWGVNSAVAVASLHVLEYLGEKCAPLGVRLMSSNASAEGNAAIIDAIRQGYIAGGHPERFRIDDLRYYPHAYGILAAHIDNISKENVGATLVACWPQNPVLEAGWRTGAYQITWGGNPDQSADALAISDHIVITEEGIAAGAYISREPKEQAALISLDFTKILVFVILVVSFTILAAAGVKV